MADKVAVARRLLRVLITRPDVPACFACLEADLRVRRTVIEAIAIGAAATLSNVDVRAARCSVCGTTAPTVLYRS